MKKIKKIVSYFFPPENWRFPVLVISGLFIGIFLFVIYISKAPSYLSEKPSTCVNCHVMNPYYTAWSHSSHANVTTCNDCHVPHDNIISKYYFKATDGLRHSYVFTFRWEPQVIRIKEAGVEVVQENCERCHEHQVHYVDAMQNLGNAAGEENENDEQRCWFCHRDVPHGRVTSLSATPNAKINE